MKEIHDIKAALEQVKDTTKKLALATLVKVEGSTYRRPGARMLMGADGLIVGAISGGCLESDVFEKAQQVMNTGSPCVVKYDSTSEEDLIWGLGLGCQGIAYVLIESLPVNEPNQISFVHKCLDARFESAIATVFNIEGESKSKIGDRLLLNSDIINHISDEELAAAVLRDTQAALQHKTSVGKQYQLIGGKVEVFIQVIQPPLSLVILGAGYDVLPVVRFGQQLGWHITVVDNRQREASRKRFQEADRVEFCSPQDVLKKIDIDERTVAVVMTHNYLDDLELLRVLLPSGLKYLGVLGPKKRTARLLQELQEEGVIPTPQQQQNLYSPVGLDIGADNSEEIALAIIAEIQAVTAKHQGGFLRNRTVPIHDSINSQLSKN
ncbi:XdhC family protein [Microcoleus sp. MON1_C1]|uniref:XdhC family protein n=1 Tax=Microcoleus sp. MON1_C1 TaxID=2818827 RepID=UPI002FD60B09